MNDVRNMSILFLVFAGALFLYAIAVWHSGNHKLIARDYATKMKDPKAYARQFGRVMALVAAAPFAAGIVGLTFDNGKYVLRVLLGGIILAIAIGADMMKKVTEEKERENR